jgi:hypothetical protein
VETIPIIERKLGREKAAGLCFHAEKIEIDPRQNAKERMDTLIHEVLHWMNPCRSEKWVIKNSRAITRVLHKQGYRRIYDLDQKAKVK